MHADAAIGRVGFQHGRRRRRGSRTSTTTSTAAAESVTIAACYKRSSGSSSVSSDSLSPPALPLLLPNPLLPLRLLGRILVVFQRPASDKIFVDDASLAYLAVFEADDDHPMALGTAPPAVRAVIRADGAKLDEAEVAGGADIVVASTAVGAVEARRGRGNGIGAVIALCGVLEECVFVFVKEREGV